MTRHLVTGGCGFLGSTVAARLLESGAEVCVIDDLSRAGAASSREWLAARGTPRLVHADVRNAHDVDRVVRDWRPDVVYHLAGQVAMTTSIADPRRDFETNVVGTFNVLDSLRRERPGAIVLYASTNKVYGDLTEVRLVETPTRWTTPDHPEGFDERLPLDFRTPYGCSKGAAEQYVLEYTRSFGLRGVVFRHSTIYGSRQRSTWDQGWVGWFVAEAVRWRQGDHAPVGISGDGKQVRDLLYVDDAVDAYLAAIDRIDVAAGQVFNLGGGIANSLSLRELFTELEARMGVRLTIDAGPWRSSDQRVFVADARRAQQTLGWKPKIDRNEGLRRLVEAQGG